MRFCHNVKIRPSGVTAVNPPHTSPTMQLQGKRAEGVTAACGRVEREVRRARVRVRDLQGTADSLAREIEVLQAQVAHARPEVAVASREAR